MNSILQEWKLECGFDGLPGGIWENTKKLVLVIVISRLYNN